MQATPRPIITAPLRAASIDSLDDARRIVQVLLDTVHELNARIYFLQDQLAVVATATSTTIDTLEDY